MPMVTILNLRKGDPLTAIEAATTHALTSMPELAIEDRAINVVPMLAPEGFEGEVTRINVDLWEHPARTKNALQELAARVADAFQTLVGKDRKVKVVIRPYDVTASGWVSQ